MPKHPLTRGEKWLCAILVPLLGLVIGVGSLNAYVNREPVVVIPTPVPTPQPNGFDLYIQAGRTVRIANPPVDPIYDPAAYNMTPAQKTARYSLARRETWLKANQAGLAIFKRAQSLPCRVPVARSSWAFNSNAFTTLRTLGRNKVAEANTYKMRGQWYRAATTAMDILKMASYTSEGGDFFAYAFSNAIRSGAYQCMEDLPAHLTGPQARLITSRLESLYPSPDLVPKAMEEDKWEYVTENLAMMRSPRWREFPIGVELTPWQRFQRRFLTKQAVIDDAIRVHNYAIEITQNPPGTPLATPPQNLNPGAAVLVPIFQDYVLNRNACFARAGLLLHRAALRAYRAEHGTYPDSLDALVPRYLSRTYLDPFGNGQSKYHYRKQRDSYRLWSVGSDNVDNGGKSVPRVRRKNQILITWPNPVQGDNVVGP